MQSQLVLIIDDKPDIRKALEITLLRMGLNTITAGSVKESLLKIQQHQPDLCLTDMRLPDGSGIDIVRYIQRKLFQIPIAIITAYGTIETAVEALKAGACDFVSKPVQLQKLRNLVTSALKTATPKVIAKKQSIKKSKLLVTNPILGQSVAIKTLKRIIKKLARSQAPIYIYGESGSGKELVAKQIHALSPRAKQPFVPINCGAIPESLMESEFFGHKKGSFTGATTDKMGLFQAAHRGTLFLDEIADLPLNMQVKLLRAIQEKAVKPVGALKEIPIDIRLLSATHKPLEQSVAIGQFRQDLYYRLNVIKLNVPPLRERQGDINLLTHHFLNKIIQRWQLDNILLSKMALETLNQYDFPGNVRELENILERASTLCENNLIQPEDLQLPIKFSKTQTMNKIEYLTEEGKKILQALEKTHWNRTAAAELLGMTFRQLRYRIKKFKLDD